MDIGITSVQRDRNPYIIEWIAFHLCVGFNRFYIYSHRSIDGMNEALHSIAKHYPVVVKEIDYDFPQHTVYVDSVHHHLPEVDWMAYIDGDEFLFPVQHADIKDALAPYQDKRLSALAAYWTCYGSSGHLDDPDGLLLEQYTRHSRPEFHANRYIKSIVKGKRNDHIQGVTAHIFATSDGTYDEKMRILTSHELMGDEQPSQEIFRINHYMTQSYDFYRRKKSQMIPPDGNFNSIRSLEVFDSLDRNECDDGIRYKFLVRLKLKVEEMKARIGKSASHT